VDTNSAASILVNITLVPILTQERILFL